MTDVKSRPYRCRREARPGRPARTCSLWCCCCCCCCPRRRTWARCARASRWGNDSSAGNRLSDHGNRNIRVSARGGAREPCPPRSSLPESHHATTPTHRVGETGAGKGASGCPFRGMTSCCCPPSAPARPCRHSRPCPPGRGHGRRPYPCRPCRPCRPPVAETSTASPSRRRTSPTWTWTPPPA
jgi:hypothetical protein